MRNADRVLPPSTPPTRLLVIDDDPLSVDLFCEIATIAGLAARGLSDSRQLAAAFDPAPDIIILDLFMPHVDGIEVLRELKQLSSTTAVILVSGGDQHLLAAAAALGRRAGPNILGTLAKPVAADVLTRMLREPRANSPALKDPAAH